MDRAVLCANPKVGGVANDSAKKAGNAKNAKQGDEPEPPEQAGPL